MRIWLAKRVARLREWHRKRQRDKVFTGGMVNLPGVRIITTSTPGRRNLERDVDGFAQPTARTVGVDLASCPDQTAVMVDGVIRMFPREPRTSDELERSLSPATRAEFARFRAS